MVQIQADELERVLGSAGDAAEEEGTSSVRRPPFARSVATLLVGAGAICVLVGVFAWQRASEGATPTTVRGLLESPQLSDAVGENLMRVVPAIGDRDAVRAHVAERVQQVSAAMGSALDSAPTLSASEAAAVLRSLRLLSDPRMVKVNAAIVEAIRDAKAAGASDPRAELKRRVVEKLRPRRTEMLQLYEELLPPVLRGPGHERRQARREVDPERMRLMKDFDARTGAAQGSPPASGATTAIGAGAVMDQLSVLLSLVNERHGTALTLPVQSQPRKLLATTLAPTAPGVYQFCEPATSVCDTYTDCFACVEGEAEKMQPMNIFTCLSIGMANSFDSILQMFE